MKHTTLVAAVATLFSFQFATAQQTVSSPDGQTQVTLAAAADGSYTYQVSLSGQELLQPSPLGLQLSDCDTQGSVWQLDSVARREISTDYEQNKIKQSKVEYRANEATFYFAVGKINFSICFRVSNHNVAFRYQLTRNHHSGSVRVMREHTGYRLPSESTSFLTPQSDAMVGWKRTKPSYEEPYRSDAPLTERSAFGHGYTFPALFRVGEKGWVLLCETGVDSRYCGSRLGDYTDGIFPLLYPMPEENNGNGTSEPAFSLPGHTPWRTITVGADLAPIVETTVMWDVVEQQYQPTIDYRFGKGTWSWILWQDGSINYADQVQYIDLAAAMGFQFVLIDNWWDTNIGHQKMEELVRYAHSKGVDVFLWYSSSGYWNDIEQGPVNKMDRSIARKTEMAWLRKIGVKGIKVDFFGGDKQETMRLYEDILSDANDNHLMVIFHGCTIPRGWERMYPNYVGSEAILASENLIFGQGACDTHAYMSALHPFIRNTIGCMEFGGTFLNHRLNRTNDGGTTRRTSDVFELATAVFFQNPIQNFAIAPNNLTDAPQICLDFLRDVPTEWDETRLIEGYPGKYCVLARRSGQKWYYAAINAQNEPISIVLPLAQEQEVQLYTDNKAGNPQLSTQKVGKKGLSLTIAPKCGAVVTF